MSFIRNLTFFENANWMNNPIDTYRAENKLLQLKLAKNIGLKIPTTIVTNKSDELATIPNAKFAVKSLDTALFTIGKKEAFFYTNIMEFFEINIVSICNSNITVVE